MAISILAIVALIAWRGLGALLATRERLEPEAVDLRAIVVCFGQLDRDAAQAVPAPLFALPYASVVAVSGDASDALRIVRIAPPQPDGAASLQTITYTLADGALVRRATPPSRTSGYDSSATATDAAETVRVLDGVTALRVRVWQQGQGWVPAAASSAATAAIATGGAAGVTTPTPAANAQIPGFEVSITRAGHVYRRVLVVG